MMTRRQFSTSAAAALAAPLLGSGCAAAPVGRSAPPAAPGLDRNPEPVSPRRALTRFFTT